jgi:PTS system galactitol-specific IIC component
MGVGFLGINLVISGLFYAQIAPAATAMVVNTGAQLDMTDMSWAPMAAITWAWPLAILMWPIQIGINLAMLALRWTKTMNVDMWCVFVKSFIAMLIIRVTGNVALAFALASVQVVLELKMGDWISYLTHEYTGIPGITVPHLAALGCMLAAPVNAVLERIPGLNRIKTDPQTIRDRLGMFGEPMLIGWIIGLALGIAAGYQFREVVVLSVAAAAALVTMPMMARLFMESLAPVAEAATTFMRKRLPGREIFIGLDWPVLAGNPATYGAGLLAIPLMIGWMLFLPGNHTLIFGAIADWAWIISPIAVMMGGDILRILIASAVVLIPVYLWTSTYVGPIISGAASAVGQILPEGVNTLTWFGTPPLNMALLKIADLNLESVAWIAGVAVLFFLAWRLMPGWNNKAKERLIAAGQLTAAEVVAEAASD